jgi:hypothetical protein
MKAGMRPEMTLSANKNEEGSMSLEGLLVTGSADSEKTTVLIIL